MKYKMLEREENGLCRVQALKDFGDVKKGDIGGYIEKGENLSQEGDCWVYGDAERGIKMRKVGENIGLALVGFCAVGFLTKTILKGGSK